MPPTGPAPAKPQSGRVGSAALTPDEVRKKAHVRLAERLDFGRSRSKPISLLRQEARRVLELFLDLEVPLWPKADRDRITEEVIGEALGLGPLDELFRDETVHEFMVLAYNQVILRKGDVWLPTSVHFRDREHYKRTLARLTEQAELVHPGPQPLSAMDIKLANGFRVLAIAPPSVLDQPTVAVFVRGPAPAKAASGIVNTPAARPDPDVTGPLSGRAPADPPSARTGPVTTKMSDSGTMMLGSVGSGSVSRPPSSRLIDPLTRVRQRVTERLIQTMASAGMYDIGRIPPVELHKVVAVAVAEQIAHEKLGLDSAACDQLTLEILAGIHR